MRVVGTPVKEERLIAADELTTCLRHANVIPSELTSGMSLLEWEYALRRIVLLADTSSSVPGIVEQSGKSNYIIKTGEMVASMSMPVSTVGVVVDSCEDHAAACGTGSCGAERVGEDHSVLSESVQVRGSDGRIAVTAGVQPVVVGYH
jgi:hypothetical protein